LLIMTGRVLKLLEIVPGASHALLRTVMIAASASKKQNSVGRLSLREPLAGRLEERKLARPAMSEPFVAPPGIALGLGMTVHRIACVFLRSLFYKRPAAPGSKRSVCARILGSRTSSPNCARQNRTPSWIQSAPRWLLCPPGNFTIDFSLHAGLNGSEKRRGSWSLD
jgi:hypothetical protein